jgi:hypothetical protein
VTWHYPLLTDEELCDMLVRAAFKWGWPPEALSGAC